MTQTFLDFGIIPIKNGKDKFYLLPVYQGVSIYLSDFAAKNYLSGAGRRAKFASSSLNRNSVIFQYYMNSKYAFPRLSQNGKYTFTPKIVFRDITNSTNSRSVISTLIPNFPYSNKLPVLTSQLSIREELLLAILLSSFALDFIARMRLVGTSLNFFIMSALAITKKAKLKHLAQSLPAIIENAANLFFNAPIFAKEFLKLKIMPLKKWALTAHERLRLTCILNAVSAFLFELSLDEYAYILRDDKTNLRGFWRVDKDKPKEMRLTTLSLEAYNRLCEVGIHAFIKEDWQFAGHG